MGDHVVVGIISICVSLGLLALTAVWASMPSATRAVTPAPDRPGKRYRCYCWSEPVVVFIEAPPAPMAEPTAGPRAEAPTVLTVTVPPKAVPPVRRFGKPLAPRIQPPKPRGRHAKPPAMYHAARPDSASLAGASGGGWGTPPVRAVV